MFNSFLIQELVSLQPVIAKDCPWSFSAPILQYVYVSRIFLIPHGSVDV